VQVAIIGPGGIGSTFAFQLSRAGHDVTVVARGRRLEQLRRDHAIVTTAGERAAVTVTDELDPATPWDLVLVTVLASQVDAVLPALGGSSAKTVMFMFNTFQPLDRLRNAVGADRFAFGFPSVLARLEDGRLSATIPPRVMRNTATDPLWAKVFTEAGLPTTVQPDMQSWLRTHAALIVPLAIAGATANRRGSGLSRTEARNYARAMAEAFRLVHRLGDTITPAPIAMLSRLPVPILAPLLWGLSRLKVLVKTIAVVPTAEPRMLIDEMSAIAPEPIPALLAIRP
jgi:2-dehydropantoate 2-reductase